MSKIELANRSNEGVLSPQGNTSDDILNLTGQNTDAEGYNIISGEGAIFIPNDLVDRQSILDTLDQTLDICTRLYNLASTAQGATPDPTLTSDIDSLKNNIETIKKELK